VTIDCAQTTSSAGLTVNPFAAMSGAPGGT
jgi:hypothetical protein